MAQSLGVRLASGSPASRGSLAGFRVLCRYLWLWPRTGSLLLHPSLLGAHRPLGEEVGPFLSHTQFGRLHPKPMSWPRVPPWPLGDKAGVWLPLSSLQPRPPHPPQTPAPLASEPTHLSPGFPPDRCLEVLAHSNASSLRAPDKAPQLPGSVASSTPSPTRLISYHSPSVLLTTCLVPGESGYAGPQGVHGPTETTDDFQM